MSPVSVNSVWLHGFTCDPSTWDHWPAAVAPALPFHGADIPATEPTMAGMITAVADWIGHRTTPPVIIGHSLGGMIALALALAHPAQVRAVVLVDAFPSLAVNDSVLPGLFGPATSKAVRQRAATMMAAGRQRLGAPLHEKLWHSVVSFDVSPRLGELRVPVRAIYGGRGRYRANESARLQRNLGLDRVGQCELRVVEGAGHFVHWEAPAALAEVLQNDAQDVLKERN